MTKAQTNEADLALDEELLEALLGVGEHMKPVIVSTVEARGLSGPQGHALNLMHYVQRAPMRELAQRMKCDPSNITGIVDRLEDAGYVARHSSRDDRRIKEIELTEAGKQLRTELRDELVRQVPALQRLERDEKRQLLTLLAKAFGPDLA